MEGSVLRNVAVPRLQVFAPTAPSVGTAAIICPGGGFHFLSMESEGFAVARYLCAKGVTSLVLTYRLVPTPASPADFMTRVGEVLARPSWLLELTAAHAPIAGADGRQAVRVARSHASSLGYRPDRIVMVGFSAGGMVTAEAVFAADPAERPDAAAIVYMPTMRPLPLPDEAPPIFVLAAIDDPFGTQGSLDLYQQWHSVKRPVELHIYDRGGHGFGMNQQGLPIDGWPARLTDWLAARGYLSAQRDDVDARVTS
jgi:acetyl esterase/lipase